MLNFNEFTPWAKTNLLMFVVYANFGIVKVVFLLLRILIVYLHLWKFVWFSICWMVDYWLFLWGGIVSWCVGAFVGD